MNDAGDTGVGGVFILIVRYAINLDRIFRSGPKSAAVALFDHLSISRQAKKKVDDLSSFPSDKSRWVYVSRLNKANQRTSADTQRLSRHSEASKMLGHEIAQSTFYDQ